MTTNTLPLPMQRPVTQTFLRPVELEQPDAAELRREAMRSLDPMVRRLLARAGGAMPMQVAPVTIYDAVYPAIPELGGHWTATSTWMGFLMHTIASYTVALAFDREQRPSH